MWAPDTRARVVRVAGAAIAMGAIVVGAIVVGAVVAGAIMAGAAAGVVAVAVAAPAAAASAQVEPAIALPVRHGAHPPAPGGPPALPAGADALAPVTLTVLTRWEQPGRPTRTRRQTVLRTADRVLVITDGLDSEWLFERNPVDGRRVSGSLIDHATRRILVHRESDLRGGQQVRGWADVLTLRVDLEMLTALRATGERETTGGETFARYVGTPGAGRGPADVWWSARRLLPLRVTTREGPIAMTSTIESFRDGVDAARLAPPASRFPAYRVVDATDAREDSRH